MLLSCLPPAHPPIIIFHTTTYSAAASVATGVSRTFIDLDLTAGPCVPRGTGAGVATLAGVGAGSTVEARLVVGAVIQIWNQQPQKNNMNKDSDNPMSKHRLVTASSH